MAARLHLVPNKDNDSDLTSATESELDPDPAPSVVPRWWRAAVILVMRHGNWFPPLGWVLAWALGALRSWSVRRALQTLAMQGEIPGWNGEPEFDVIAAFLGMDHARRETPEFRRACEVALLGATIRVPILRHPVILPEEVLGQGYAPFGRHFGAVCGSTHDPLPRWMRL